MAMLPSSFCGSFKYPMFIPAPTVLMPTYVEPLMEPSVHEVRLNRFMGKDRTQPGTERTCERSSISTHAGLHSSLLRPMSGACQTQWSTSPTLAPASPSSLPSSQASPQTNCVGSSLCSSSDEDPTDSDYESSANSTEHSSHTETEAAVESVGVKRGREPPNDLSFIMWACNEAMKSQKRE